MSGGMMVKVRVHGIVIHVNIPLRIAQAIRPHFETTYNEPEMLIALGEYLIERRENPPWRTEGEDA